MDIVRYDNDDDGNDDGNNDDDIIDEDDNGCWGHKNMTCTMGDVWGDE